MITDAQSYIKLAFTGVGSYTYSMVCRDEAHLSVYHINSEGSSTKLLTTQYSVTLGTGGAGGAVAVSDAALTAGFLFIKREVPLSQTINLTNSSRLDMELLERGLDTNVMLIQQIRDYVATSTVDIPWRGEWSGPDVSYTIRELIVAPNGDWYICQETHTSSASFSTDLTAGKWLLWIPMSSYADVTARVTELETNLNYNEIGDNFGIDITGNAATATTAAACSGNAATATTASACSGNAATATTATTAAACSGNAATATNALSLGGSLANTYAKLSSPTFTGSPTAPTPSDGSDDTRIATTEFVKNTTVSNDTGYNGIGSICFFATKSGITSIGTIIAGSSLYYATIICGSGNNPEVVSTHGAAGGSWKIMSGLSNAPTFYQLLIAQRIA